MPKKKNNYLIQGTILAASSLIVRFIGLLYKIPITRIIGDEGMGSYINAQELYNLALILSSYSIPLAVSKLVSARDARKRYQSSFRVFVVAMATATTVGFIASVIVYVGADAWARFTNSNCAIALRVLAPTIFIFSIMGVLRGLFQGKNTMFPTAISQVIEQIINAIVSIVAAYLLMKEHNASINVEAYGAAGGTAGTLFGAVAAFFFLSLIFIAYLPNFVKKAKMDQSSNESYKDIIYVFFITVFPIILSQTVYQLSGTMDRVIFANIMENKGLSVSEIDTLFGVYGNKYRQLTNLPVALATALGTTIVPTLAMNYSERDYEGIKSKIASSVKLNMLISIPAAIGMGVLAKPIILIIYTRKENFELSVNLLRLGSIAVIFFALSTLTNGVLQGINRIKLPVIHAGISLGIHVILLYVLLEVFSLGAYGMVIGNVTFAFVVCVLNWISVAKHTGYKQEIIKTFLVPIISASIMGVFAYLIYEFFVKITHSAYISITIAVVVAVVIYFIFIILLKAFTAQEIVKLPRGRKILKICKKLHLM